MKLSRTSLIISILLIGAAISLSIFWRPISKVFRDAYFEIVLVSDPLPTSCDQLALKTDIEKLLQDNVSFFNNLTTEVPLASLTISNNGLPCPEKGYIEILVGSEAQRQKAKKLLNESYITVPYYIGNI